MMGTATRLLFCLTFAASVVHAQHSEPGGRQLSLDEAVRLAQRNSPAAVAARNASRSGAASVRTALAQFLPTANFSRGPAASGREAFLPGQRLPFPAAVG